MELYLRKTLNQLCVTLLMYLRKVDAVCGSMDRYQAADGGRGCYLGKDKFRHIGNTETS